MKDKAWVMNPIDAFLLARLEKEGSNRRRRRRPKFFAGGFTWIWSAFRRRRLRWMRLLKMLRRTRMKSWSIRCWLLRIMGSV